jgi:RNA-directed DNA polymerase
VSRQAFDTAWRAGGLERRWQARLIRYADALVSLCRSQAVQGQAVVAAQLQTLGLPLNGAKTRVLDARRAACTFLGFTVRVVRSRRTGREFPLGRPSAPACQRLRDQVRALPTRAHLARPTGAVIAEVNQVVRGWAGYFHFQHCGRAFSALRRFVRQRVRIYLRRKHRTQSWGYQAFPEAVLYGRLGL